MCSNNLQSPVFTFILQNILFSILVPFPKEQKLLESQAQIRLTRGYGKEPNCMRFFL